MKYLIAIITLIVCVCNVVFAGGRGSEATLLDDYLSNQAEPQVQTFSFSALEGPSPLTIDPQSASLVLTRQALDAATLTQFETAFSFNRTLTQINTSGSQAASDTEQLLNSLLQTFSLPSQTNNGVEMELQTRFEADLSVNAFLTGGMQPTAIFNRFDLAASDGSHCGEYRIVYHSVVSGPFFLIFEAQYPNLQPGLGKAGCLPVADFWQQLSDKTDAEALTQLEQFFYRGINRSGVDLPAVINFNHYTAATGQVRSNQFVDSPWQLREFKTALNTEGQPIFTISTVKSNPLAELFKADQIADTDALKALRTDFAADFIGDYIDHLLAPELAGLPLEQAATLINSIQLNNDGRYNEFQSDAFGQDNTDQFTGLDALIEAELEVRADTLPGYTVDMIKTRAEAMSCGGCHANAGFNSIAPEIIWPSSNGFTHVSVSGQLSTALTEHFLPARAQVLAAYLSDEANILPQNNCDEACQLGSANSSQGGYHRCALKSDNTIECWGTNFVGATDVPEGLKAKQIAVGLFHTCALKPSNTVVCWGYNLNGQSKPPSSLLARQVVSGSFGSCVIKLDNSVECWGQGQGYSAKDVPAELTVKQIALGYGTGCAVKLDNAVACWGNNERITSSVPEGITAKQVVVGNQHACALQSDNTVKCWGGYNWHRRLPENLGMVRHISAGSDHTCALTLEGAVRCWGASGYGQIAVPEGLTASQVIASGRSSCALTEQEGAIRCWGANFYGVNEPPEGIVARQL